MTANRSGIDALIHRCAVSELRNSCGRTEAEVPAGMLVVPRRSPNRAAMRRA
jgi:hypothetical protein